MSEQRREHRFNFAGTLRRDPGRGIWARIRSNIPFTLTFWRFTAWMFLALAIIFLWLWAANVADQRRFEEAGMARTSTGWTSPEDGDEYIIRAFWPGEHSSLLYCENFEISYGNVILYRGDDKFLVLAGAVVEADPMVKLEPAGQ